MPHLRALGALGAVGAVVAVGLLLATTAPVGAQATTRVHGRPGNVAAVHLSVDGRDDEPLGLGNPRPTLSWQMTETRQAEAHPCTGPAHAWPARPTGRPATRCRPRARHET